MGMSTDLDCVYVSIKLKDEKNKVNNIAINYYSNRSTRTIATSRGDKKKKYDVSLYFALNFEDLELVVS